MVEVLENLITIRDDKGVPRVQLGKYNDNKYGLKITDSKGKNTVLDERGILQIWQEGRTDNVDKSNPLELNIFIPKNTLSIHQTLLRFKLLPFRAYSKATKDDGYTSDSTSWDGGNYTSTDSGGGVSTSTQSSNHKSDTTGKAYYDGGMVSTQSSNNHEHNYYLVKSHEHTFSLPSHDHNFSIPNHNHNVSIGGHSHSFTVASHNHDIDYGIYKDSGKASGVKVLINGVDRTIDISGSSLINENKNDLNITKFMNIGKWNTISLSSNSLGRIDSTIFTQALIGFDI